jgi:hypothetical protein
MPDNDVLANQKLILQNQSTIIANQDAIKNNQAAVLANQETIKNNQHSLHLILKNQEEILRLLRK